MNGDLATPEDRGDPTHPNVRGLQVGVVGMARSGVAAAKLVARHGGSPFVSDAGAPAGLASAIDDLNLVGIPFEVGGHSARVLDVDFVVVSPGVPLNVPVIESARERGIPVYSEIEIGWWFCSAPVVAVTGSNGKTTTSTLIGHILAAAGIDNAVCGNIGLPLSSVADAVPSDGVVVAEVSSFQLETIDRFRPMVSLILNLQPDHLDRHGSFDAYASAKYRIASNQQLGDVLITNHDDDILRDAVFQSEAARWQFSLSVPTGVQAFLDYEWLHVVNGDGHGQLLDGGRTRPVIRAAEIALPGTHNLANAAAACLACSALGVPVAAMTEALRAFGGVEHRIERVGELDRVRYVNDSKATNVDATCVALQAMDRPTVLILGGVHKGAPYTPLLDAGEGTLKAVVALGESSALIVDELGGTVDVHSVDSMAEAVETARNVARAGDTVLLSPACASFDMFENFEHRGRTFKEIVARLSARSSGQEEQA